jgi:hypothetical protein
VRIALIRRRTTRSLTERSESSLLAQGRRGETVL